MLLSMKTETDWPTALFTWFKMEVWWRLQNGSQVKARWRKPTNQMIQMTGLVWYGQEMSLQFLLILLHVDGKMNCALLRSKMSPSLYLELLLSWWFWQLFWHFICWGNRGNYLFLNVLRIFWKTTTISIDALVSWNVIIRTVNCFSSILFVQLTEVTISF